MPSIPVAVNVLAQAHPTPALARGCALRASIGMGRSLRHRAPADRSLASRTSATHLMKMFRSVLLAKDSLIPSPPQDKGLVSYEKTWRCSTNGSSNTALREHALLPSPIACSSLPFAPFAGCDYTGRVLYGIPHCKTRRFVRHCVPHCDAVRSTFVLTCFGTSYPVATFSHMQTIGCRALRS